MAENDEKKPQGMSDAAWQIYKHRRRQAEPFKVRVQMLIGIFIFATLVAKALLYFLPKMQTPLITDIQCASPLALVAVGLAFSAGVELAYMLFTPGPDEAIEPLILGLSATTLLIISKPGPVSWEGALSVAVFSAAIVGLFWARRKLLGEKG